MIERKKIFFSFLIIIFWFSFLYTLFFSSIKSPLNVGHDIKLSFNKLFPEAWGFFTRNPREEELSLYKWNEEQQIFLRDIETCTSGKYLYGISRDCRMRGGEVAYLAANIRDSLWINGRLQFINSVEPIICDTIHNKFKYPTILGDILLVRQERIPWAWSSNKNLIMPYKYIQIHVK